MTSNIQFVLAVKRFHYSFIHFKALSCKPKILFKQNKYFIKGSKSQILWEGHRIGLDDHSSRNNLQNKPRDCASTRTTIRHTTASASDSTYQRYLLECQPVTLEGWMSLPRSYICPWLQSVMARKFLGSATVSSGVIR